jgi:signal transduction histidine kinase/DNA-binding response OmpR family regulator
VKQGIRGVLRRHAPWLCALAAALIGLGFLGVWTARRAGDPSRASQPFRVGFHYSPPAQLVSKDGTPTGPVIEIFSEACRRLHIPITWVHAPEGPESNLQSGRVDLWPLLGDLPERRKFLYISGPWTATGFWMVTLHARKLTSEKETAGLSVGHGAINLDVRMAHENFSRTRLVSFPVSTEALTEVCLGRIDAALISGTNVHGDAIRQVKACADKQLRFCFLARGQIPFGIGASRMRPGAARAADAIRQGIGALAGDGTLSSIYFRWFLDPNNEAMIVHYLAEAQRRNQYMAMGLCTLALMLILLAWQTLRVRAARRVAECANQAKSLFLANMSHEIRTPINGVMGMTELAIQATSREEQLEYLELSKSSGAALLTVINDILDFSKIEAGKLELDPIPFAFRDELAHCVRSIAMRAHEKGLELIYEIADDVPDLLVGDAGRLRQIILNLLSNAVKFTDRGEVELRVTRQARQGQIVWLEFSVRDTGIGIASGKQAAVFDAFSQADGSTTRQHGGTGLGLSISRQLAGMMGGRIRLESQLGSGTTVRFTAALEAQNEAEPTGSPGAWDPAGLRVLLIEDNATCRGIVERLLVKWRMNPVAVESLAAGLAAFEQNAFDLILLDIHMPEVDAARIGTRAKTLGLSSLGSAGDADRRSALHLDAYVSKPVGSAELFDRIQALFTSTSPPAVVPQVAAQRPAASQPKFKVLLAEDNVVNQTVVRRMLEKLGHQVTVVSNGRLAVEAVEGAAFDVILMDIQMPELDGLSAAAEIRDREAGGRRVPIVALTANVMTGDRERCLHAGMDGYVSKPINLGDLLAMIAAVCAPGDTAPTRVGFPAGPPDS